jgi:starch phosphorylase
MPAHVFRRSGDVLSGDHCKSASDLGIALSLASARSTSTGYFEQEIEPDGRQQHFYPGLRFFAFADPADVLGDNGRHLDREHADFPIIAVYARVWLAQVGRVPVCYSTRTPTRTIRLTDPITGQLYVSGREMRICQEIVIGVGRSTCVAGARNRAGLLAHE